MDYFWPNVVILAIVVALLSGWAIRKIGSIQADYAVLRLNLDMIIKMQHDLLAQQFRAMQKKDDALRAARVIIEQSSGPTRIAANGPTIFSVINDALNVKLEEMK